MKEKYLAHALEVAKRGIGFTSPNPCVGAVLVKDDQIIAEGWHKQAGSPHAEAMAISQAKKKQQSVRGATLYVTLEPCSEYRRTPPCTNMIAKHGIKRVVIGSMDEFWRIQSMGILQLRKRGVEVELLPKENPLYRQIMDLNQSFLKWASVGLPYVVVKHTTTHTSRSVGEYNNATKQDNNFERSISDAVMVDWQYIEQYDPLLAPTGYYQYKKLLRIVIDPELTCDINRKVFRDSNVLVIHTNKASKHKQQMFDSAGISHIGSQTSDVQIKKLLQVLGKKQITRVFVEGGEILKNLLYEEASFDPIIVDSIIEYFPTTADTSQTPPPSLIHELGYNYMVTKQIATSTKHIRHINTY